MEIFPEITDKEPLSIILAGLILLNAWAVGRVLFICLYYVYNQWRYPNWAGKHISLRFKYYFERKFDALTMITLVIDAFILLGLVWRYLALIIERSL